jgi:Secretion system C-terminal sorting domain
MEVFMRKYIIFLFCLVLYSYSFAADESASVTLNVSSSFSDCNDISGTVTSSAHYHWFFTCNVKTYKWNGSSWDLTSGDIHIDHDNPYDGQEHSWSTTNESFEQAGDIITNGTYQFKASTYTNDLYDTDTKTFTVTDVTSPSAPTSLTKSSSGNHPLLSWNANSESDLRRYKVYRIGGDDNSWYVTGTSYVDEEFTISPYGDDVSYEVKAEDWSGNMSSASNQVEYHGYLAKENLADLFKDTQNTPISFQMLQNYPNPFNPTTSISFSLPEQSNISLKVYDIGGREVKTLAEGFVDNGYYTATFDASGLTSGVYIYRFVANGVESGKSYSQVKRMLLIK